MLTYYPPPLGTLVICTKPTLMDSSYSDLYIWPVRIKIVSQQTVVVIYVLAIYSCTSRVVEFLQVTIIDLLMRDYKSLSIYGQERL